MNKSILNFVIKQMNIVTNYFPGILGGLYFINTGLIFRGIWATCKYIYNAQTRNRIKLLGFQYKNELLKRVKEENLPKFIGGYCNCDPYGCLFSNVGPWNEKEIVSKGEKRRKVDHLKKIRAITQGLNNNDNSDDLDDDNFEDEENEDIEEDEKEDDNIKKNKGKNNEIENMEEEIKENVNIDELKSPNDNI